ncbi:ABC transporter substrate-binding protein [Achromobacter sp. F4_2707]|uniref:ABC transporter substrate-binding protein n=1 Tax=Achromobacter sp. F4_2707 TaxID=3114286 RepID=UPI0039C6105F
MTAAFALSLAAGNAVADIKMGALYPFSGALAQLGDESFRGLELAVEERNAKGGVLGEQIRLVKADAVDANQAVGEARRLTSVEDVAVVFGTFSSALSYAGSQVTELAGVPFFELGAISDSITDRGYKNVYRSNSTAKNFAYAMVDTVSDVIAPELGVDPKSLNLAIIHEDGLYGKTVAEFQTERAKELGLNVVETLPYSAKAVDLSALILRLRGAKVDVVLQTSYQNDTILFFRQAKSAGFKPKAMIGAGGGYSLADTAKALGKDIEGAFNIDFPQFLTNEKGAPGLGAFVEAYKERYGMEPRSGHSLVNYVGAHAFLDIIEDAGSTDGDKVREAVMAYKRPVGSTATGWGFDFAENGQNQAVTTTLMQWQDGKLVTVWPEAAAVAKPIVNK